MTNDANENDKAKKKRRGRGEGGLYWDKKRQRYIAEITTGYTPAGKRIVRRGSGKTITEARTKLKEVLRDHEDGLTIAPQNYTVTDAVEDWLTYGLSDRAPATVNKCTTLCRLHIIPDLGARKLRDLRATDVDRWLADKAKILSTRSLGDLYGCLNRAIKRAMARDKVKRNVVPLCSIPTGQVGRPSKSLTMAQAKTLLDSAKTSLFYPYIVLSLLTGARTEELRALKWSHVDLDGQPDADPAVPPSIQVWRSVRAGGDTKTRKSRRTLALPERCVAPLRRHRKLQDRKRAEAGERWQDNDLVFCTGFGAALLAGNVRRTFRRLTKKAGIGDDWTPRELRHSFVSLLSASGVRIEDIADLCGHSGTTVTERVYRHQLRPVLIGGAVAMDKIFDVQKGEAGKPQRA